MPGTRRQSCADSRLRPWNFARPGHWGFFWRTPWYKRRVSRWLHCLDQAQQDCFSRRSGGADRSTYSRQSRSRRSHGSPKHRASRRRRCCRTGARRGRQSGWTGPLGVDMGFNRVGRRIERHVQMLIGIGDGTEEISLVGAVRDFKIIDTYGIPWCRQPIGH